MYLKNIEVQGFKSFANKINFEFHNGITAIVGPNGSGKSNVADAVRWVLGEQSTKTLRGNKMEDVIFSGTTARKPAGFASVTLTIDNSTGELGTDDSEVAVTRKIYRNGDSEYKINGKTVRLKDINELFMDTGLGRDGYSIIGQGRIAEIVGARSSLSFCITSAVKTLVASSVPSIGILCLTAESMKSSSGRKPLQNITQGLSNSKNLS